MGTFRRVHPGEKLVVDAKDWNTQQASAEEYLRRVNGMKSGQNPVRHGFDGVITVKNDTGNDLGIYSCIEITGISITPTDNLSSFQSRPFFVGTEAADDAEKVAIAQLPIADGEYGPALIMGMSAVQIEMTDEIHEFAKPTNGDPSKLTSDTEGPFRILYVESGTGTKWASVIWPVGGGSTEEKRYCRIIAASGSAPPFVYSAVEVVRTSSYTWVDKSPTVTLMHNLFAYGEAFHPGCASIPIARVVRFTPGATGEYLTDAIAYPPVF